MNPSTSQQQSGGLSRGNTNAYMSQKANIRKEKDVRKLLVSNFDVKLPDENDTSELRILFEGPKDSSYEGVSITY